MTGMSTEVKVRITMADLPRALRELDNATRFGYATRIEVDAHVPSSAPNEPGRPHTQEGEITVAGMQVTELKVRTYLELAHVGILAIKSRRY